MTTRSEPVAQHGNRRVTQARWLVLVVAVLVLAVKLTIAANTQGTNDAFTWTVFAEAVRQVGPVEIYSYSFPVDFYNHPPPIGYFLWLLNGIESWGPSIRFLVRACASICDVVTAVLVFEMIRRRRALWEATGAGVLVATSPVLLIISGFHANTDPIFVMLVVAAAYLLVDRKLPGLAGVAVGLAIGVKIVPIVVVPLFLVYAAILGRRAFAKFAGAMAAVLLITWAPALLTQWDGVMSNVIGYVGVATRQWGLAQFITWTGNPDWGPTLFSGPWRFVALPVSALLPAFIVWRTPVALPAALGIALGSLLVLSPAFGHQYLVWPAAALFFVSFGGAALYNWTAGILIAVVYTRWSSGFPWDRAVASQMTGGETVFAALVWVELAAVVVVGTINSLRQPVNRHVVATGELRPSPS